MKALSREQILKKKIKKAMRAYEKDHWDVDYLLADLTEILKEVN